MFIENVGQFPAPAGGTGDQRARFQVRGGDRSPDATVAAPLAFNQPAQLVPDWQAWYYNEYKDLNKDCAYYRNPFNAIAPALQRFEAAIDWDWGTGGPSDDVGKDNFLACWEVSQTFARGCYRFHTYTDDGVRLFINNQLVLDHWEAQPATEHTVDVIVPGDSIEYLLRVDYFEQTDQALARVWWESLSQQDLDNPACHDYPHWKGEYFRAYIYDPTNPDAGRPSGGPVFTRDDTNQRNPDDPGLDFDWGLGSPGVGLSYDHFAVRWTRTLDFAGGYYRFYTRTDDGVRLWVDDVRVINQWHPQSATTHYADVYLSAGPHTVRMEYFEMVGRAEANLWWEGLAVANLAVSKTAWPEVVQVGNGLTYTIVITNAGPSQATGVTLTDTLPLSVTFSTASPDCAVRAASTGNETTGTITCDLGDLAPSNTVTVTIVVTATAVGTATNTVTVAANEADPITANNTAIVETPLSVVLVAFAAAGGNGEVLITWATASEIDNEGFNVYRSEAEEGEYVKINEGLIPARGNPSTGASYTFVDTKVRRGRTYYYKLEGVDTSGVSSFHGPVWVTVRGKGR